MLYVIITLIILAISPLLLRVYNTKCILGGGGGESDLIRDYNQIPERLPYARGGSKTNVHNGQVKLFLSELEFATHCMVNYTDEVTFLYAGSAPSNKISYLAELFPRAKFVLVDPNEHYIMFGGKDQYDNTDMMCYFQLAKSKGVSPGNSLRKVKHKQAPPVTLYNGEIATRDQDDVVGSVPENVSEIINNSSYKFYIIENYFTDDLAKRLRDLKNLYFISDIRTHEGDEYPSDVDICWNSAMMYNWLRELQPKKFMLKFRCPWPITDNAITNFNKGLNDSTTNTFNNCKEIDFVGNFRQKKFIYIKPEVIWVQAFAGQTSTESRLVGSSLETCEFDMLEYEEKFAWFNDKHRQNNEIKNCPRSKSIKCFNRRNDCALAVAIFNDYLQKYSLEGDSIKMFSRLLKMINRNIC